MAGRARKKRAPGRPTMVQVAELAGVSIFTVSAVINGTSQVSDALRQRVEEAIRVSGYRPSVLARSLRTGKTKTIGLSIGDITNPFYTDVVARLQRTLHASDYAIMLCCNDRSATLQDEQIALMRGREVDGLIIAPAGEDPRIRAALDGYGGPVVLIDRMVGDFDCDAVVLDNRAAVGVAMDHLIGLGHRRIGFVAGTPDSYTGRERLSGYRCALADAEIAEDPQLIQYGNFRIPDSIEASRALMRLGNRPTALLAANNQSAIGAMKGLAELGLTCPADVSLAAIDDFPWADVFEPKLTTVAQPVDAIADRAAEMLLDRLGGAREDAHRVVLRGELCVRTSTRPLAREAH